MSRSRAIRIAKAIFNEIADASPAEQEAVLAHRCEHDPEMRRMIQELLAADQQGNGPLPGGTGPGEPTAALSLHGLDHTRNRQSNPSHDPDGEPETLLHFAIEGTLGRGGMGVVYDAIDTKLERRVALKLLRPDLQVTNKTRRQLQSEARILAKLQHPNISVLYSCEESEGTPFLVMEYVPGDSLSDFIDAGPQSVGDALEILVQAARAVAYAHDRGVVHRDLKPGNIKISSQRAVKVLDFGVAALLHRLDEEAEGPSIQGTPGYMSPEQLSGAVVDPKSDVWSLGCVLYELLTGRSAFPGKRAEERIEATVHGDVEWNALPESVPEAVRQTLMAALATDPTQRPSAEELAQACVRNDGEAAPIPGPGHSGSIYHVPQFHTAWIGRSNLLRKVEVALDGGRLVTLGGPGGVGKSRLAAEVCSRMHAEFKDGVWFVELAGGGVLESVSARVARRLGAEEEADWTQALCHFLTDKDALLVLDNCEHVLESVRQLARSILDQCPGVRLLCTSQTPLALEEEQPFDVATLELPPKDAIEPGDVVLYDSARLLLDRARQVRPGFEFSSEDVPVIVELCWRMEGLPLAIELAAARLRILSLPELAERTRDSFAVLRRSGEGNPRHTSLWAAIAWSHDTLSEAEKIVLRRLSVFRGGWSVEAAESVCGPGLSSDESVLDVLDMLSEKSLIQFAGEAGGLLRLRMLESVREFAAEQLVRSGEETATELRLRDYLVQFVNRAEDGRSGREHGYWVERLEADAANLLRSIESWLEVSSSDEAAVVELDREASERVLPFVAKLADLWSLDRRARDAMRVLDRALAARSPETDALAIGEAECALGHVYYRLQGPAEAKDKFMSAIEKLRGQVAIRARSLHARAVQGLGAVAQYEGELEKARELFGQSLAESREADDRPGMALALRQVGSVHLMCGEPEAAESCQRESLAILRGLGNEEGIAHTLRNLGDAVRNQWRVEEAIVYYEESLEIGERLARDSILVPALFGLATTIQADSPAEAEPYYIRALEPSFRIGHVSGLAQVLEGLGALAAEDERWPVAASLLEASAAIRERTGFRAGKVWAEELRLKRERARAALGDAKDQVLTQTARAWSIEEAIRFAQESSRAKTP